MRPKLAALVEPVVRPRIEPIRLGKRERGHERQFEIRLRDGHYGDIVAAELVEEFANPGTLFGSKSSEQHGGRALGFLLVLARGETHLRRLLFLGEILHGRRPARAGGLGGGRGGRRPVGRRTGRGGGAGLHVVRVRGVLRLFILPRHRLAPLVVLDVLERETLGVGEGSLTARTVRINVVPIVVEEPLVVAGGGPLALHLADPVVLGAEDGVAVEVDDVALGVAWKLAEGTVVVARSVAHRAGAGAGGGRGARRRRGAGAGAKRTA